MKGNNIGLTALYMIVFGGLGFGTGYSFGNPIASTNDRLTWIATWVTSGLVPLIAVFRERSWRNQDDRSADSGLSQQKLDEMPNPHDKEMFEVFMRGFNHGKMREILVLSQDNYTETDFPLSSRTFSLLKELTFTWQQMERRFQDPSLERGRSEFVQSAKEFIDFYGANSMRIGDDYHLKDDSNRDLCRRLVSKLIDSRAKIVGKGKEKYGNVEFKR